MRRERRVRLWLQAVQAVQHQGMRLCALPPALGHIRGRRRAAGGERRRGCCRGLRRCVRAVLASLLLPLQGAGHGGRQHLQLPLLAVAHHFLPARRLHGCPEVIRACLNATGPRRGAGRRPHFAWRGAAAGCRQLKMSPRGLAASHTHKFTRVSTSTLQASTSCSSAHDTPTTASLALDRGAMPPRLRIECPEWVGQDPEDAGAWETDTPRSPLPPGLPGSLPSSPSARKTKSRAARAYHRISSLKDAKVRAAGASGGHRRPPPNNRPPADSSAGRPAARGRPPSLPGSPAGLWQPVGQQRQLPRGLQALQLAAAKRPGAARPECARLVRAPPPRLTTVRPHPPPSPLPQVLVVTDMHRSESALDPALFQYHQHFESPWQLVGKTHLSEVRCSSACQLPGPPRNACSTSHGAQPRTLTNNPSCRPPVCLTAGVPCAPPRQRRGVCRQALAPALPLQAAAGALPARDPRRGRAAGAPQHRQPVPRLAGAAQLRVRFSSGTLS